MKKIPLTNDSRFVLIINEDYELTQLYTWYRSTNDNGDDYAYSTTQPIVQMHRLIMRAKKGERIDHINHNGLDNRKKNLRYSTASTNGQNRKGPTSHSSTGVLNVQFNKQKQKYIAVVDVKRKRFYGGSFDNIIDATEAAIKLRKKHLPYATL